MKSQWKWFVVGALLAAPAVSLAQTDEIQVYDANIASKGKFNLEIHNNFTPDGRKIPDFPGGVESNHALVGVAEWAYGVTDWLEQGLYLPLQLIRRTMAPRSMASRFVNCSCGRMRRSGSFFTVSISNSV